MNMKGLNLGKMKKVSSDKESATFQHQDGHTIKIATKNLSHKLKSELDKIPMAEGGKVEKPQGISDQGRAIRKANEYAQSSDQSFGKPASEGAKEAAKGYARARGFQEKGTKPKLKGLAQGGRVKAADGLDVMQGLPGDAQQPQWPDNVPPFLRPNAEDDSSPAQENAPDQDGDNQEPADTTSQETPRPPAARDLPPQQVASAVKNHLSAQDMAWQQDLANQHITPETYSDLFAKKDTLGKIGTLFGMMVSGFGSGLSHQPNMVMSMMDKQIQNDLSAQTTSKSNAQNFLRLNQQHQLNDAQIKSLGANTQATSFATAQAQMLQASYHSLASQVAKMPEGPQKENAKQMLGVMYSKIGEKINNINDQAAGASAYQQMLFGNQQQGQQQTPEQNFQQKTTNMRMVGPIGESRAKDLEQKHFPGIPGQASKPLSGEDTSFLQNGTTFQNQLDDFINWTKNHSGDLSPTDIKEGQAKAADLQGAYRQATHGGVYKEGEQNFISKLIDDTPTKFFNDIRVVPSLEAISGDNKRRVDQYAKNLGFEGYQAPSGKQSHPNEGKIAINKQTGEKRIMKNGEWVPVKQ